MTDRRYAVPFDPEYFARRAAAGEPDTPLDAFRHAYASRHWEGAESPSGPGSSLDQTAVVRRRLPQLLSRLGVQRLLDLPCGDFHWMSTVDLGEVSYIGGDLLPELIEANDRQHRAPRRAFRVLDLLRSELPIVDLVLCRDCLVHFAFADIERAVGNIRASGAAWLLTTSFPAQGVNEDITTGDWRPLDLTAAPFHWPVPDELFAEECTEGNGAFADKSLGLWRVAQLPGV
ncbi:MAG: class I SAM-dependent methyltransferase [Cytophagaceae bacterium]|nr:class I SAM-dependent methyltransferase [Gemmatimonadaceae bacterium]